jgi:hypothetical protein
VSERIIDPPPGYREKPIDVNGTLLYPGDRVRSTKGFHETEHFGRVEKLPEPCPQAPNLIAVRFIPAPAPPEPAVIRCAAFLWEKMP